MQCLQQKLIYNNKHTHTHITLQQSSSRYDERHICLVLHSPGCFQLIGPLH